MDFGDATSALLCRRLVFSIEIDLREAFAAAFAAGNLSESLPAAVFSQFTSSPTWHAGRLSQ